MSKMKNFFVACASAALAILGVASPSAVQAETPALGWTAAHLTSDPSCIRTDGTLVYAYAGGDYSANGVAFTAVSAGDFPCSDISWTRTGLNTGKSYTVSGVSGGYGDILSHFWSINGSTQTVTLKNLTAGHRYLVQIIGCNQSNNDHNTDVYVEGFDTERMRCGAAADGWEYGGTLIGVFETTGTEYSFNLKFYNMSADWVAYNAIQVRELSGGDDPDATTYAVSWIGGANASVEAKVDGVAISSGADVEDGKSVVFTVTPNTGYEFAEASYQDWDKSGGALTRMVTVNGAAVNIEIPNVTRKDIPVVVYGWKAEHLGTSETAIYTVGTKKYAYCSSQVGNLTVNTVPFDQKSDFPAGMSISVSNGQFFRCIDAITLPSGVASDSDYGKLLTSGYWGPNLSGNNDIVITFNGLVEGKDYLVQLISHSTLSGRNGQITVGGKTIDPAWDFGGSLVGVFKAEGSSQAFTFTFSDKSFINGLQVRELAEGEGAGIIEGDEPTPTTYAVSWTGGANASVDAKVDDAAISSGASVEDGKSVVFTVAPNTNYEFAEASYTDWTLTEGVLTRTVTVNGAALSVTVPNATKKPDPPAPTAVWTAAPMSASGDTIRTEGTLVYALAGGAAKDTVGSITVNGVTFTTILSFTDYPTTELGQLPISVNPQLLYDRGDLGDQGVTDPDYAQMLGKGFRNVGLGDYTFTLTGLEPNARYLVQIVCHRNTAGGYKVTAPDGVAQIGTGFDTDGYTYGGTLVGEVTATAATYSFTLTYSGNSDKADFNAFQVRKLPDEPDPEHELGWTAAKMTADPASIRKDGVLCYAYACGGDYIVNDVEFIKILNSDRVDGNQDKPIDNANLRWEVTNATQGQDVPGTTGDYTGLLKHCWWWWSDAALTLRNLTPGHTYLVQVIGCRAGHGDTAQTSVAVVEAGDNSIFMKAAGDGWECGGTLVGTFEASDTTQTFHFNKFIGSWSAFNAVQVRDLSLTDDDAVAIIERGATTNYFFTIEDAYNGAAENETIKLVKDADFPMNYPVFSKSVDLDLNGHSITRSSVNRVKEITSDTEISNGTLAFATEAYSADLATPFFVDGAALTLDALKVGDSAGNEPLCLVTLTNGASVVLSGDGVYHAGSLFKSYDDGDTMTITGGRYVLRGWSFPGNETGDFTKFDNGTLTISGGSFSIAPDKSWIASGYVILHDVTDRETPYHAVPADAGLYTEEGWTYYYADAAAAESAHVAKRETAGGVKYYTSIQDAVEAADGVGTVTLVADVPAIDREVVLTGTVTLDGNGHSVSVAHPYVDESGYVSKNYSFNVLHVVSVANGADAVLRDISITGGGTVNGEQPFVTLAEKGLSAVANSGTLLMENVTVTRSNGAIVNLNEGKLFMDNCRIVRNCRFCAGGLFNMYGGFAVMNRTSLSENRSLGQAGGGGAAENGGTLFVNNCVVVNNSSTEIGGAINNYGPGKDPKLYLMNTTIAGNFSSIFDSGNQYEGKKGGGLGLQSGEKGGEVIAVNSIITCNYQTRTDNLALGWDIKESDILSVEGNMDISLYYTVFTAMDVNPAGGVSAETNNVRQLAADNENVFNAYYASGRIYQNANPTAMEINGAQLISKDDGSLDASLARYAPVLRKLNSDKTAYVYGDAVYGTDGVYTYFDPSNWKNSEVKMAYAEVVGTPDFFTYDAAGELQQVGNIPLANATSMVTNYYESAWGRSFGVAGASGWLMDEKIRYTVQLADEPQNGTVSGVTLFGDTYEDGTVITLTATPGYARDFLGWYEITDGGATTNFLTGSDKTIWELTVDHDYLLLAKFSDLKEILTPEPFVHTRMADDGEDGPKLYPISVTTDWMTRHYTDFVSNLDKKVSEDGVDAAKAWLTTLLEQVDGDTGLKMWQDYVLGIEPGDKNAKIWINSPQYMSTSKNLIRMEMNKLSPVSGTKYTVNYRLDKKLGEATTFARADVNGTGSYDVKVENDPSGLYVIDVLFIPEGKATSEEYVTTVNTAGLLRVSNTAKRAAVSVPWLKLQPTGSDPVRAVNLVKTTNLTPDDVLYVYDLAQKDYRAWKMDANGNWSPLNVFKIGTDGFVDWENPDAVEAAGEGSEVARGLGIWLERANTNDYVYLCGQYDGTSVAETPLSKGWNLVGNPSGAAFDLKNVKPAAGDQIVVPTAAEPKTYTYENGAWGYWKKVIIERSGGRKSVQTVRETEDTVVPAGLGFWYISGADGGGTLDWTGAKEEK